MAGIFGDPLYLGDWPASVKQRVPMLPAITADQARRPPSYSPNTPQSLKRCQLFAEFLPNSRLIWVSMYKHDLYAATGILQTCMGGSAC